tara:strand:+ start:3019 stop:3180 length:162 start_codon:yes stop_codon:yes gene_type:complete
MDGLPFLPSLSTSFFEALPRESHASILISSDAADHELAEELLGCGYGYKQGER